MQSLMEFVMTSTKYKNVPITAAKAIAKAYDKDQVIVITWDKKHGKTHVTTFGKTLDDCEQAAKGGNAFKKAMGWPDKLCNAVPARVRTRQHKIDLDTHNCERCGMNQWEDNFPKLCRT